MRLQAIITGIVCASGMALAAPSDAAGAIPALSREAARPDAPARGIVYVLAPEWAAVYRQALRQIRDDVGAALGAAEISHDDLRISGVAIRFRLRDTAAIARAQASVAYVARTSGLTTAGSMPGLAVQAAPDGAFDVALTGYGLASVHDAFMAAARTELRRWLSRSGFDDYLLSDDGGRIRLVIPSLAGPEHAGRQC